MRKASDWHELATDVIRYARAVVAGVKNDSLQLTSKQVVQCYDEISDVTCALLDPAELCRNTHPDEEWRRAASQVLMELHTLVWGLLAVSTSD